MQNSHLEFYTFGEKFLVYLLELSEPPFGGDRDEQSFRQLNYIERYVGKLGCLSVVVEEPYIDRDYIEDFGVFYSRSLFQYPNSCRRLHFFSANKDDVMQNLADLLQMGRDKGEEKFLEACASFSKKHYIGFSVIKPLNGCPVGRTVLRYNEDSGTDVRYRFESTRGYKTHLTGVELTVLGLAFQQQDVGVSACATTALWSSLHKVRDFEEILAATPAQITRLASQYTLPFGRSMPSEGLSIDQMCQAIQALGVSPKLIRASTYQTARGYLHSAAASGFAPVLILERGPSTNRQYHAVVITGMEIRAEHEHSSISNKANFIDDQAGDLLAVYVHDDRHGPYVRAKLIENNERLELELSVTKSSQNGPERWRVTHLLIPMHSKIRLTFGTLRKLALSIVNCIHGYFDSVVKSANDEVEPTIIFETQICRANEYVKTLFLGKNVLEPEKLQQFFRDVKLARYVGVVRVSTSYIGGFDILVDTTSTPRNPHFLAIVARGNRTEHTARIAEQILSKECGCLFIV